MSFTGVPYCIKKGDTLWSIAAKELGDPHAWPSIYAFNYLPEVIATGATPIKDPDLIYAGKQLNLPIHKGTIDPRPREESKERQRGSLKNQLRNVPDLPMSFVFEMPDTSFGSVDNGVIKVTVKLQGKVVVSSERAMPVSTVVGGSFSVAGRELAGRVIGKLLSKPSLSFDGNGLVTFSNQLILSAGNGRTPIVIPEISVDSDGKFRAKLVFQYPELRGSLGDHHFSTLSFAVVMEIEKSDQADTPSPGPDTHPLPVTTPQPSLKERLRMLNDILSTQNVATKAVAYTGFAVLTAWWLQFEIGGRLATGLVAPIIMLDVPGAQPIHVRLEDQPFMTKA